MIVENKTLLFSIDEINGSDTLQFNDNGSLVYIHTGIGVRFEGKYILEKDRVQIEIVDVFYQFGEEDLKETVLKFDLVFDENKYVKVDALVKKDHLFSKVSLYSKVKFIK